MISLNFNNVSHALASFFKTAAADAKKIVTKADVVIQKVEGDKSVIEGVSAAIANGVAPGSAAAIVPIEDAGFALLGCVDAALKSGGAAAEQKLLDAGLDATAIANVKAVASASQAFYGLVSGATAKPATAPAV